MVIQTKKFSEFLDGGDISPDQKTAGLESGDNVLFNNPFPLLAPGTSTDRPTPASTMYYRLRFNTTLEAYEYYSPTSSAWIQLEDSDSLQDGPFLLYQDDDRFTAGFDLGSLSSGVLKQSVLDNVATPAISPILTSVDLLSIGVGDILYGSSANTFSKLSGNVTNTQKFLSQTGDGVNSAPPVWQTVSLPTGAPLTANSDTNITLSLGGSPSTALVNAASITASWSGQLDETRGGTGLSSYTLGDLIYSSATNTLSTLPGNITANKNFLTQTGTGSVSAAPAWGTISASDIGSGAALTKSDDTNVTLTLGGSPSTALLASTSISAGWNGELSLARGGTNAALTASNGGIVYSTASALGVLAGTATANQVLLSGSSTTPAWSTATYPPTTIINQLLYSSSANTVSGLSTANSALLVTNSTGVPALTSSLTNGQIVIGSTGATPTPGTITNGTGIAVSNGAASITISTTGAAANLPWTVLTNNQTLTMSVYNGYVSNGSNGNVNATLPSTAAVGEYIDIWNANSTTTQIFIKQVASQRIIQSQAGTITTLPNYQTTTGTSGILTINPFTYVRIMCHTANTGWGIVFIGGNNVGWT